MSKHAKNATSLNDVVEEIVRAEFADDAVIDSVSVEPDFDADGDPILNILVVFSSRTLDINKAKGLTTHLWPALMKREIEKFPIVSFRSRADHNQMTKRHNALSAAA